MQIFNRKWGTERRRSQLFFILCCFTSVECYIMPPFNHVRMLTETVKTGETGHVTYLMFKYL